MKEDLALGLTATFPALGVASCPIAPPSPHWEELLVPFSLQYGGRAELWACQWRWGGLCTVLAEPLQPGGEPEWCQQNLRAALRGFFLTPVTLRGDTEGGGSREEEEDGGPAQGGGR